jgi:D-tyrosyl-tRNA(Tyr) deacylase
MIALIQRVSYTRLSVDGKLISEIGPGLLVFLGVAAEDDEAHADWLAKKIVQLRIFSDTEGKMNRSVLDEGGDILIVSQFTLLADASQGNRPSYIRAARPEKAIPLYERMVSNLSQLLGKEVKTGIFAADMKIELLNDGPVTISLDTQTLMKKS